MSVFTDLKEKVILVTGSSRGIGFETAKLLLEGGAHVILNSFSSQEELKSASVKLNNSPFYLVDVSNDREVQNMVNDILAKYGRVDGLVNNAGGGGWASVEDPDTEWQKSFNLDILGAVHTCRYVLPVMKSQKRGSVVNVSSLWGIGHTAKPSIASYSVAKAGLSKLTENLAQEYGPFIRVNAVAPGWTKTRMMEHFTPEQLKIMESNVLLQRLAEPHEIANVIGFLLSDMASYVTGQIISADGGYLLARTHV